MNCLKPDHPCYAITFPFAKPIEIGSTSPGPPFIQHILSPFTKIPSFYDPVLVISRQPDKPITRKTGTGRRFDTIRKVCGSKVCVHVKAITIIG